MKSILTILFFISIFSNLCHSQQAKITNENGKYGLFDLNYGQILDNSYDNIYTINDWSDALFIVKSNNKYGLVYFKDLDSLRKPHANPQWYKTGLIYDNLSNRYSDRIGPAPYFNYQRNGKFGFIFLDSRIGGGGGVFNMSRMDGFGDLHEIKEEYQSVGRIDDSLIVEVEKDDKFWLLQLKYSNHKFSIDFMYDIWSETFPKESIYKFRARKMIDYYEIKQNNKIGAVTINDKKEIIYLSKCECDELFFNGLEYEPGNYTTLKLCKDSLTKSLKINYNDFERNIIFDTKYEIMHTFGLFEIDTNKLDQLDSKCNFLLIFLGFKDSITKSYLFVDILSGNTFNMDIDVNTNFNFFYSEKSIISTFTNDLKSYFEVKDVLSGKTLLYLPQKENIRYTSNPYMSENIKDKPLLIIEIKENKKKTKTKEKVLYHYDFKKNMIIKGKPKTKN